MRIIVHKMKAQTIILLITILVSAFLPASLPYLALTNVDQSIGALDVCHSSTPAISSGGEMPFLNERPCSVDPSSIIVFSPDSSPLFTQALFSLRNERPPIA